MTLQPHILSLSSGVSLSISYLNPSLSVAEIEMYSADAEMFSNNRAGTLNHFKVNTTSISLPSEPMVRDNKLEAEARNLPLMN